MRRTRLACWLFFLAICAGLVNSQESNIKSSDLFVELDDTNFETFVDSNNFVLVMYYGTFSKKSKSLLPSFTSLGLLNYFKKKNVKIARINAGKYEHIKDKFMIDAIPTFALFAHSVQIKFKEEFNQKSILSFVQEKLLYRVEEINTIRDVNHDHHDFAAVYFANSDKSFIHRAMSGVKMKHYTWNIYRVNDKSLFNGREGVLALRHHDNFKKQYSGDLNRDSPLIERFLVDSEFPDWSLYNKKTNHWIEEEGYPVLAVLYDGPDLPVTDLIKAAKQLGKEHKHTIITVFVKRDQKYSEGNPILKELGGEDLSTIDAFIVAPTTPYHKKYILRHDYKAEIYSTHTERLREFIREFEHGHLERFHMSQVLSPEDKVLGSNIAVRAQTLHRF